MYKEYLKEANNLEIYEAAYGFIAYKIVNKKTLHISDMYVKPDYRGSMAMQGLLHELCETIDMDRMLEVSALVEVDWGRPEEMLAFLFRCGFELDYVTSGKMYLSIGKDKFMEKLYG